LNALVYDLFEIFLSRATERSYKTRYILKIKKKKLDFASQLKLYVECRRFFSVAEWSITKVSEVLCEMLFLLRGKFGEADILGFCDV